MKTSQLDGFAASAPNNAAGMAVDLQKACGSAQEMEYMLSDDEALEGVQAWLHQQAPKNIVLNWSQSETGTEVRVETPAAWLLRLVRHARRVAAASNPPGEN